MYKLVLQVPEDEADVLIDPWQDSANPHGPHIKIYRNQTCPETGRAMTFVRCKHKSLQEVEELMTRVLRSVEPV